MGTLRWFIGLHGFWLLGHGWGLVRSDVNVFQMDESHTFLIRPVEQREERNARKQVNPTPCSPSPNHHSRGLSRVLAPALCASLSVEERYWTCRPEEGSRHTRMIIIPRFDFALGAWRKVFVWENRKWLGVDSVLRGAAILKTGGSDSY